MTSRTICRSGRFRDSSGESTSSTTGSSPLPSLPVDSAMSCSAQSAKPTMWVPSAMMPSLSLSGWVPAIAAPEHEAGVVGVVEGEFELHGLGLIQQFPDVDAGEPARHQSEGGERRVPASHVRVGVEDAVPVGASSHVERGIGVGDHDDALGRARCPRHGMPPRRPASGCRSRRSTPTSRRSRPRSCSRRSVERGTHLTGVRGVEHRERHAVGAGDDLGGERRAAHAPEHDVADAPLAKVVAQGQDVVDQRARRWRPPRSSPRRIAASSSAAGPHSDGSSEVIRPATPSLISCGTRRSTASAAAPVATTVTVTSPPPGPP